MTTSSSSKKFFASNPDAKINTHSIGQYSFCRSCSDPAGLVLPALVYPFFPSRPPVCHSCGFQDNNLAGFFLFRDACNSITSPAFPTLGEARLFGELFGATKQTGFSVMEFTALYNQQETESESRQDYLTQLAHGRRIFEQLMAASPTTLDQEDLHALAISLRLDRYALPIFWPTVTRAA